MFTARKIVSDPRIINWSFLLSFANIFIYIQMKIFIYTKNAKKVRYMFLSDQKIVK